MPARQSHSKFVEGAGSTIRNEFIDVDFSCVTSKGQLVPLEALMELTTTEVDPARIYEVAKERAVGMIDEISKNAIVRQIIQRKLGNNFIVTKKPITTHKNTELFSQYCRSQHDVCIQHKVHRCKAGVVQAGVVGHSMACDVKDKEVEEGQVVTSILELKTGIFAHDQTIAQMTCTLTDCAVEVLKEGKQVNRALAYGLSVNYSSMETIVYKMVMDFSNGLFEVRMLKDVVPLAHALNLLITAIGK